MKKVIVIGGGVSGLVAGIYAQKIGFDCTVIEKHSIVGGQLTGWTRAGHHIDNCIHWLTGTSPYAKDYAVWQETGMLDGDKIYQSESLYTYEKEGLSLSLYSDIDRLKAEMLALSPRDAAAINEFIGAVDNIGYLFGTKKPSGGALKNARRALSVSKYLFMSVEDLSKTFDNEVIRGFLCSLLTEDFSAIALLAVFSTYTSLNGGIPKGGSLSAAMRIKNRFLELGGKIITGNAVKSVTMENGVARSVVDEKGKEYEADAVIITADPETVFKKMLPLPMPKGIRRLYESKKTARFSALQCAFSVNVSDIPFRGDFIFDLMGGDAAALKAKRLVLREFSHEPTFAPAGKTVLQSMIFVDENICREYLFKKRDNTLYQKMKTELAALVAAAIRRKFPNIGELTLLDVWTPATYKEYTLTETGSFMSFAFKKGFLPLMKKGNIKGAKNLFLASQWLQVPGGLPIAARAGINAVALADNYFKQAKKSPRTADRHIHAFPKAAKTAE